MYASTLSLISLLILHRLVASATEVQAVLGGAASQYGYNGPGVYQIYSYTSSLPIVQQQAVAKLAPPYLPAGRWVVDIDSEYYPADPLKRPIG
ncbi:MAG: hypothetical protein Q9190_000035 [Brigantiaea leucoxantha]